MKPVVLRYSAVSLPLVEGEVVRCVEIADQGTNIVYRSVFTCKDCSTPTVDWKAVMVPKTEGGVIHLCMGCVGKRKERAA